MIIEAISTNSNFVKFEYVLKQINQFQDYSNMISNMAMPKYLELRKY